MKSLPLGFDIGATAVRIAHYAYDNGQVQLQKMLRIPGGKNTPDFGTKNSHGIASARHS